MGDNANAFIGGFRMWDDVAGSTPRPAAAATPYAERVEMVEPVPDSALSGEPPESVMPLRH